jgi:thymidylate synthase
MNTHWRSRDGYKASFMNMFALTDLQGRIAREISKRTGKNVRTGRYVDISDSFHIYGSYAGEFERFVKTVSERPFEDKTWSTEFAQPFFDEAAARLEKEKEAA